MDANEQAIIDWYERLLYSIHCQYVHRLDTFDLPVKCTKLSDLKDGIILAEALNEM